MIAKLKDGTPCTIRALLTLSEKCYCNFIRLTENWVLTIKFVDRKANGRIRRITLFVHTPMIINGKKTSFYRVEASFDGNEKSANDFLDNEVFAKGIRVDEDTMKPFILSLDDCAFLSAEQEKDIKDTATLMNMRDPNLLMWSTKWLLRSEHDDHLKMKDEFMLKKPIICNEKQKYAAYKETPTKLDEPLVLVEGAPSLEKKRNPREIMVSSACEGMHMDTD